MDRIKRQAGIVLSSTRKWEYSSYHRLLLLYWGEVGNSVARFAWHVLPRNRVEVKYSNKEGSWCTRVWGTSSCQLREVTFEPRVRTTEKWFFLFFKSWNKFQRPELVFVVCFYNSAIADLYWWGFADASVLLLLCIDEAAGIGKYAIKDKWNQRNGFHTSLKPLSSPWQVTPKVGMFVLLYWTTSNRGHCWSYVWLLGFYLCRSCQMFVLVSVHKLSTP